ncbi:unnamed protein product [Mytilus coruscus]|uniref:Integrase zinc-binding domain-containing protein n=1 Tax=Mytilus coruscus TaxID=42192 RepID=A0A6J8CB70_MYTCO|nr:unnamed protein product [Mytilus coruscus]
MNMSNIDDQIAEISRQIQSLSESTIQHGQGFISSTPRGQGVNNRKSIGQDKIQNINPKQESKQNQSTAHTVSSGSNDVKIKPSKYDGLTPWMDYLSHFEMCALVNMWSEHQKHQKMQECLFVTHSIYTSQVCSGYWSYINSSFYKKVYDLIPDLYRPHLSATKSQIKSACGNYLNLRAVIPMSERKQVLEYCHDIEYTGHLGTHKTREKICQSYYWPGIQSDVRAYVASCAKCNRRKRTLKRKRASIRLEEDNGRQESKRPACMADYVNK